VSDGARDGARIDRGDALAACDPEVTLVLVRSPVPAGVGRRYRGAAGCFPFTEFARLQAEATARGKPAPAS